MRSGRKFEAGATRLCQLAGGIFAGVRRPVKPWVTGLEIRKKRMKNMLLDKGGQSESA
jgi:hypothetical protein